DVLPISKAGVTGRTGGAHIARSVSVYPLVCTELSRIVGQLSVQTCDRVGHAFLYSSWEQRTGGAQNAVVLVHVSVRDFMGKNFSRVAFGSGNEYPPEAVGRGTEDQSHI